MAATSPTTSLSWPLLSNFFSPTVLSKFSTILMTSKEVDYYNYLNQKSSSSYPLIYFLIFYLLAFLSLPSFSSSTSSTSTSALLLSYLFLHYLLIAPLIFLQFYALLQKNYFINLPSFSIQVILMNSSLLIILFSIAYGVALFSFASTISFVPSSSFPLLLIDITSEEFVNCMISLLFTITSPFVLKFYHNWSLIISISILLLSSLCTFYCCINSSPFPSPSSSFISISPLSPIPSLLILSILLFPYLILYERNTFLKQVYQQHQSTIQAITQLQNDHHKTSMRYEELKYLLANVTHDLKSPLQAFNLELDSLAEEIDHFINDPPPPLSSHHKQSMDSISLLQSLCHFMLIMINRTLDYTKIASGVKLSPSLQTMDIHELMVWVRQLCNRSLHPIPIEIEPLSENICSHIITDPQWFKENLLCLVSNAQKFCQEGVITLRCVSCPNEPGLLRIEVEDSGIGISEEKMAQLFQPFQQAQLMAGGTGLGLFSLSKRVDCLGGTCGVKNRADGKCGACFWFTVVYRPDYEASMASSNNQQQQQQQLNQQDQEQQSRNCHSHHKQNQDQHEDQDQQEQQQEENKRDQQDHHQQQHPQQQQVQEIADLSKCKLNILIVEDSQLIQKTTSRSLRQEGHTVSIANNGLECIKMIDLSSPREQQYDVILMDLHMPIMDGLEATQRIRELEKSFEDNHNNHYGDMVNKNNNPKKQFIIGLSANSDLSSSEKALSVGMNDFIAKPLRLSDLYSCLQRHLSTFHV